MSQESVDVLKGGMECFERRDVEAAMELLDPHVEWHPAFTALLGGETTVFRGHDGAREVMRQFWEVFSETHFEVSEVRDLGDQALAIGTMRARGAESGAEIESPWAWLVRSREGKATSIRVFTDPAEAIEAAGDVGVMSEDVGVMSEENVEIVRRIYDSLSRGDRDTLRDLAVPEFTIDFTRRLVEPGVVRGREEALAFLSELREPWDDWPVWEPEELLHTGDKVAALIRASARGSGSGVEVEAYIWHLWTFRDGKVLELGYFGDDREAALEAAGLSERHARFQR